MLATKHYSRGSALHLSSPQHWFRKVFKRPFPSLSHPTVSKDRSLVVVFWFGQAVGEFKQAIAHHGILTACVFLFRQCQRFAQSHTLGLQTMPPMIDERFTTRYEEQIIILMGSATCLCMWHPIRWSTHQAVTRRLRAK